MIQTHNFLFEYKLNILSAKGFQRLFFDPVKMKSGIPMKIPKIYWYLERKSGTLLFLFLCAVGTNIQINIQLKDMKLFIYVMFPKCALLILEILTQSLSMIKSDKQQVTAVVHRFHRPIRPHFISLFCRSVFCYQPLQGSPTTTTSGSF